MMYRVKSSIVACFVLVWLLAVVLHFLNYDEHFTLFHHLVSSSINFILLFAITLIAFSLGERAFRYLQIHFSSSLETFVFATSLGFGILSLLIFVLGFLHLLYRSVCYTLLLILLASSIPQVRLFLKKVQDEKRFRKNTSNGMENVKDNSPFMTILGFIFIISMSLYLIQVFAPPLNYDTLAYHLAIPKLYATEHGIFYIPHNVYANFPMTMEFLYLFSLLLYGDTLAKLVHFSMGILVILAIYSFSAKYFNKKVGLLASFIFYNIPFVGLLSGWAFNDLMLTLYGFLAVVALLNWFSPGEDKILSPGANSKPAGELNNPGKKSAPAARLAPAAGSQEDGPSRQAWLNISAIFCGLSIGTKYPALLLLVPILLLAIAIKEFSEKKSFKFPLKKIALFLLITLIVASPWFMKNVFYTHNPVYPFFYNFFNKFFGHPFGEILNPERFMRHHQPQNRGIGHILSLLWEINMDKKIGPVFILFLPLLILVRSVQSTIKLFLIYGGIYFLLWAFFTHQDTRFLIPCLPALSIASAYAMESYRGKQLTLFMCLVILSVFLFNLAWLPLTIARYELFQVATGIKNRDEFLIDSDLYQYSAFHYINNEVPEDARILFIGENQTYYCNREVVSNSPLDTNIVVEIVNESSSEEDILAKLDSSGITHILLNMSEAKRVAIHYHSFNWAKGKGKLFADFFASGKYLRELFSEKGVFVYEVVYD